MRSGSDVMDALKRFAYVSVSATAAGLRRTGVSWTWICREGKQMKTTGNPAKLRRTGTNFLSLIAVVAAAALVGHGLRTEAGCNAPGGNPARLEIYKDGSGILTDVLCRGADVTYEAHLIDTSGSNADLGKETAAWRCTEPSKITDVDGITADGVKATAIAVSGNANDITITATFTDSNGHECSASITITVLEVDLDVDADYDGIIDSTDDTLELSPGGIVGVGKREPIILMPVLPSSWGGDVVLTKNSTNVKVFDAPTGGTEITFNGTDNKFANSTLLSNKRTLYVEGETVSSAPCDVTLTLTASQGGCSDEIAFTVCTIGITRPERFCTTGVHRTQHAFTVTVVPAGLKSDFEFQLGSGPDYGAALVCEVNNTTQSPPVSKVELAPERRHASVQGTSEGAISMSGRFQAGVWGFGMHHHGRACAPPREQGLT